MKEQKLRLKKERTLRRWTQKDLAEKLEVSPQTICDWEKGRTYPRHQTLRNLENLFKLNYRELFAPATDSDPFSPANNESK